ncbi:MAG: AraC family transcriptional regulator [Pseudomonadota bacterium]
MTHDSERAFLERDEAASAAEDQTGTPDWSYYERRIQRVTEYLHAHLDQPLNLDQLAEIACLSRFHWHRIYRAIQGETVAQTLKRARINKAGFELADGVLPLPQIARRCGYPNVRSFSRAFKDIYGISPGEYRRNAGGIRTPTNQPREMENDDMHPVEIRELEPNTVAGLEHKGSYQAVAETFEKLAGLAAARGLFASMKGMVGIYFDDPMVTPEAELRAVAGLVLDDEKLAADPLKPFTLEGGRHAVLTFTGPYSGLPAAYDWLYSVWLREHNHILREAPPFESYLNTPRDVPVGDLKTEICVPIR